MDKRTKQGKEEGINTSCDTSDGQYCSKVKLMCQRQNTNPVDEKITENTSVWGHPELEQRKALYSGAKIPKNRKGLGYRHWVLWLWLHYSKLSLSPRCGDAMAKPKNKTKPSSLLKNLPYLRREGQLSMTNFRRSILVWMKIHNIFISVGAYPSKKGSSSQILKLEPRRACMNILKNVKTPPSCC